MGIALTVEHGFGQLRPDTDPASIEPAVVAAPRPLRLQFDVPLPDEVLAAAADVSARHPDVGLRAYGGEVDPGLGWLSGFEHIERLSINLWHATCFDVLADFTNLRSLGLGETKSKRPSLAFLRGLANLEDLWLEAHDKDFAAVGELLSLACLRLRVPRAKSLDALRGHTSIEVFEMDFGGIRDLSPLADMPALRALQLYQVRKLDTYDLEPLGECGSLEVVSLGALRNVESLRALAGRPADTLRLLLLERMTGLATLADLAACGRLEELGLYESRPADRRLDELLECPRLNRLVANDAYPEDQLEALRTRFDGDTLVLRGDGAVRGDLTDVLVRWRAPVKTQLKLWARSNRHSYRRLSSLRALRRGGLQTAVHADVASATRPGRRPGTRRVRGPVAEPHVRGSDSADHRLRNAPRAGVAGRRSSRCGRATSG